MIKIPNILPIILLAVLLTFSVIVVAFIRLSFYYSEKNKFSFQNRFPFEAYFLHKYELISLLKIILIILFSLLIVVPLIFATQFNGVSNIILASLISLFYILSSLAGLILFVLRPLYLKPFRIVVILFFSSLIVANATSGILFISDLYFSLPYKIAGVCMFILALINISLAINPKLKKWDQLETNRNNNGEIIYVRPKISPLAISLWINYLTLVIGEAILLVVSLFNIYNL